MKHADFANRQGRVYDVLCVVIVVWVQLAAVGADTCTRDFTEGDLRLDCAFKNLTAGA